MDATRTQSTIQGMVSQEAEEIRSTYLDIIAEVKTRIIRELTRVLSAWTPSQTVLDSYPFFSDKPKILKACQDSIVITYDEDEIALSVNRETLKRLSLPERLPFMIEYGNEVIDPLPFFRIVIDDFSNIAHKFTKKAMAA